jgi:murein DD-endopeptidase MepM/ murein hydrolase activator NlpD
MLYKKSFILAVFWVLILSVIIICTPKISQAQDGGSSDKIIADLNQQIEEQRAKVDRLATEIAQHQEEIKKARNQATSFQNQIYIFDNQIAKTKLDIESKEEEIKAVELEIEKVQLAIKEKELAIGRNKNQLADFIRTLDRYDEQSYLSILLGNASFSEFFDQVKALESVQGDLQKTLNRVEELVLNLSSQKTDLDKKRTELSDLLNKLEDKKSSLASQRQTKQYLINETKKSERKFQNLVGDLKQAQLAANNQIITLERRIREELEKKGQQEKFNLLGEAALAWPTASRRLTAYFHDPDYPYRYLFEHSGIDFGVPAGTAIKAAEAGYVAKVATGTRWYGNYIMIIHNNNLATLYAHLSSISVSNDQYVAKGQLIGSSGNTGFSSGPHLHFEVRSNGIPVDPLSYLP